MNEIKETIKRELQEFLHELIRRINTYADKGISEADTKAKLIEPLFEKLGWDIRGEEIVRAYAIQATGRAIDYLFKIGDEPRLLIETKKLDDPFTLEDATRVVEYGDATGISWCILTNGREIKLYNSNWPESAEKKLFFEISVTPLIERCDLEELDEKFNNFFEIIWLLSREAMMRGELDIEGDREYAKRVVLEIWGEEKTIKFICERAKFKKVNENIAREAIKELEVKQLFPFPSRPPEEAIPPKEEVISEEKVETPPPEEIVVPTEEVVPPPPEELAPPPEEVIPEDVIKGFVKRIREEAVRETFKTTINTFRKLGRDVVEEAHPKRLVYKVKDKVFVKLKPFKNYFQIDIFNLPTGKWLSFDMEKGNLDRLKDRVNKAKEVYKKIRKK